MTTLTALTLLVLLAAIYGLIRQRRTARQNARAQALRARLKAQALVLPEIERQYGPDSHSARYLRAATYLTTRRLRTRG